jgi:hypothetical protein
MLVPKHFSFQKRLPSFRTESVKDVHSIKNLSSHHDHIHVQGFSLGKAVSQQFDIILFGRYVRHFAGWRMIKWPERVLKTVEETYLCWSGNALGK